MAGIAVGTGLWLATQALALGLAGAGHGWVGASAWSLPLLVLYPLARLRMVSPIFCGRRADAMLLAVAAVLDVTL
ncbi:hypothetical protein [uncultured Sphingomonas sp.]|uniref:hypothetical protein n=1 Tax=uncultured Sphingomonas sp. TaxID=158754 RepID=UPI0025DCC996|nr:hypothetical protein [uncultured Sphingomonas sp.]